MNEQESIERAVIGAALLGGRGLEAMVRILRPDSFADSGHAAIAAAIFSMHREGVPVDLMTVTQELQRRGQLAEIGGAYRLAQATGALSSTANADHYARIVSEAHAMRSLARIAADMAQDSGHASDPFDSIHRARLALDGVLARLTTGADITRNAAHELGAITDASPMPPGYTLGITSLDAVLPMQPGLPYVFAGRPGIGKSIVSCLISWHMTLTGEALLFSPEMTLRQVQSRILALESGVPYSAMLSRRMDEQQLDNVSACTVRIADRLARLRVDETPGITPEQVRARAEHFRKETDRPGFVLDHLHKMRTGDARVDRDETPRVSQCMEGLTRTCKDTGMFGVIMCQINRQVESRTDRRPRLADLKQTGRIEEDAAGVVLLYREGYYAAVQPWEDDLELAVAKNRDGACDVVTARCIPALNRIL